MKDMLNMPTYDRNTVEIFADIEKETDAAVLINDGAIKTWLPKSQIEIENINKHNQANIHIPEWLAKDKELI